MHVFKRGSVYWFEFTLDGVRHRETTRLKNRRRAGEIADARRTEILKEGVGIVKRKRAPKFDAAMKDFLLWSKQEHRAHPSTYDRYVTSSIALLKYFRDATLDKITPDDAESFKTDRLGQNKTVRSKNGRRETDKKIKPSTVNRELACLRMVFNHVMKSDIPLRNPIGKTAAKAFHEDNEQTRVLSYDEQDKYLSTATPTLWDIAALILETGARPEEVYRIQPHNVHLAEDYWYNPYGKTKAAKRRIKLTAVAKEILARHVKEALERAKNDENDKAFLFPCETDVGRPIPKINNAHDRAVRNSKIAPCRLYDLRHTWATRAAQSGIDLVTLAAMLGHSKINMVLRYAHPTQEHQANAMDRLELYVAEQRIAQAERNARQTTRVM